MLPVRRSQIIQPSLGQTLAFGHPLLEGLVGAWPFNENAGLSVRSAINQNDVLSLISGTGGSFPHWQDGPAGRGVIPDQTNNTGAMQLTTPSAALLPTSVTIFWYGLFTPYSAYGGQNPAFCGMTYNANLTGSPFESYVMRIPDVATSIQFHAANGGAANYDTVTSQITLGVPASYAYSSKAGAQTGYKNGRSILTTSYAGNITYGAAPYLQVNLAVQGPGGGTAGAWTSCLYIWNRVLTADEHQQIAENPWRIWQPRIPRLKAYFGTAAILQTLLPTGKASDFAAGLPDLKYNQNLSPTGKASDFAAGAPHVIAGINPVGKPSDFAVGVPTISLRSIGPTGKASDFAAGVPFVYNLRAISPGGKASDFAPGVPSLIPAQIISPGGKGSDFAAGSARVLGGPQKIMPSGLGTGFRAGLPTVSGGTGGVQVFIGGVNVTKHIVLEGVSGQGPSASDSAGVLTITSQTLGRWTATFDFFDASLSDFPEVMQTFLVMENGVPIMSGGLVQVQLARWESPTATQSYHVTAQDWSAICDRRVVNATYPEGSDIAGVVLDIWNNVLLNPNEGITANHVPAIGGPLGLTDSTEVFAFITVTQALDQLATDTGCVWWVDVYADLHFVQYTTLAACPFTFTETSKNWRALSGTATLLDGRTKQFVVSNLTAIPGTAAQQGGGIGPGDPGYGGPTVTETYTVQQAAAAARGFTLGSGITNFPILQVVGLKVNGVAQPCLNGVPPAGSPQYNLQQSWWYTPGFPFLNAPNAANNSPALPYPPTTSPYPMTADVVEVTYVALESSQSAVVVSGSPFAPATPGPGAWGSGEFDNVAQVKNINLQGDLNAIAQALLNRSNQIPIQVQVESDEPGAAVGQAITINIPLSFLPVSTQWTITGIQMTLQTGVLNQYGSQFRTVLTITSGADLGNSTKWFERLIARTEAPLPVQQFDEVTFVLAPGGSLAAGVPSNNPVPLNTAGVLAQAYVQCGTPPTGQNLKIDILDNGTSILVAPLVVPAGSAAQVLVTVFAVATVAIGDLLSVSVSYQVLTGNPTPAANVTVDVRWSTAGLPAGQSAPGVYGA